VGLDAIGALVPDRAHLELVFLDAERRLAPDCDPGWM